MDTEQLDLATVDRRVFEGHLNSEFAIEVEDQEENIPLTLIEVSEYPDHRPADQQTGRKPFGLIFHCKAGHLNQGTYNLTHPELAPCLLFLSPFEGDPDGGCKVEAILN